jgi:N-acetylglucosamine kinase-like BadF-type ATPase
MKLFLGVDGGQSTTKAVIGEERGRILGAGLGGPCNHAGAEEGRARLERGVSAAVDAACQAAGLDAAAVAFESACFGMSGGPDDKIEILSAILRTNRLIVTTDAVIALSGATAAGLGIIVIAGTGSIAYGRNAGGRAARAGGWGYVFGDEGGAFDMVRRALRAALRMEEGWGPPTALRDALLEASGARDANQALHHFYSGQWPRARIASLAPLVDAAAQARDGVALEIVRQSAQELALLASAVRGQLWKPGDQVEVAYVGGAFRSPLLLERFRLLVELEDGNRCGAPRRDPAEGALLEAYRAAGLTHDLA